MNYYAKLNTNKGLSNAFEYLVKYDAMHLKQFWHYTNSSFLIQKENS